MGRGGGRSAVVDITFTDEDAILIPFTCAILATLPHLFVGRYYFVSSCVALFSFFCIYAGLG